MASKLCGPGFASTSPHDSSEPRPRTTGATLTSERAPFAFGGGEHDDEDVDDVDDEEGEVGDDEEFCSVFRVSSNDTLRRAESTHFANFAMGPPILEGLFWRFSSPSNPVVVVGDVDDEEEVDDDDERICVHFRVTSHETLRRAANTHFAKFAMGPPMREEDFWRFSSTSNPVVADVDDEEEIDDDDDAFGIRPRCGPSSDGVRLEHVVGPADHVLLEVVVRPALAGIG